MRKKVLSILLAVCLLVGCLPMGVGAKENDVSVFTKQIDRLEIRLPQSEECLNETEASTLNAELKTANPAASVLIDYIKRHGKRNDDGDLYVEYTTRVDGDVCVSRFTFKQATGNIYFLFCACFLTMLVLLRALNTFPVAPLRKTI